MARIGTPIPWIEIASLFSGCTPLVAVMQPAHLRDRNDPARVSRLHPAGFRRVLFQRKVGSGFVIIRQKRLHIPVQRSFVEDDHVIEAFAVKRSSYCDLSSSPMVLGSGRRRTLARSTLHSKTATAGPSAGTRCGRCVFFVPTTTQSGSGDLRLLDPGVPWEKVKQAPRCAKVTTIRVLGSRCNHHCHRHRVPSARP